MLALCRGTIRAEPDWLFLIDDRRDADDVDVVFCIINIYSIKLLK